MRWLVLVVLVGCTDPANSEPQCPLSPQIVFDRSLYHIAAFNPHVAARGTFGIALSCAIHDLPGELPLDQPFAASTDAGGAITVTATGNHLAVTGVHDGVGTVRITSPDGDALYGSLDVTVKTVDHLTVHTDPGTTVARAELLAAGDPDDKWLFDDAAVLAGPPGATYSDSIGAHDYDGMFGFENVAPGTYTVSMQSGGTTYSAQFVVP